MPKRQLAALTERLRAEMAGLPSVAADADSQVPGTGDGLTKLWEYENFGAYRNFAESADAGSVGLSGRHGPRPAAHER